jgi:hypothetical protein
MTRAAGKRLQHRISIDSGMGPLYEWLSDLDAPTRAREVLYLVRLGAQVHLGAKTLNIMVAPVQEQSSPSAPDVKSPNMEDWGFDQICVPPRRS